MIIEYQAERTLRALAARAGYGSLAALGRAAGVGTQTLTNAVRGHRRPKTETVTKVATALGIGADELGLIFSEVGQ